MSDFIAEPSGSLAFDDAAGWFKTANTADVTYQADIQNGVVIAAVKTSVTQPQGGAPGAGDTAFILGPGTITGSGAVGTLALAGNLTIAADLTIGTLWAGANEQGAAQAPIGSAQYFTNADPYPTPQPGDSLSSVITQSASYAAPTLALDTANTATTALYSGSFDNNGQTTTPALVLSYDAITGVLTPNSGSAGTMAQEMTLTGSIAAQNASVADTTLDVAGLLSLAAGGLTLTTDAVVAVLEGGTLESGSGGITIASTGAAALSATGNARVQSTGGVTLGAGNGAAGSLSLADGATMQTSGAMLAAAAANSSGVISLDGTGTALNVGGALTIGAIGSGTLSLTNGAMLTVAGLLEAGTPGGSASGGFGTLSIASTLVAESDFAIDNARAFFDAGAGVSVADMLSVGQGVGGFGTLDVQQGASVAAQGGLLVGGMGNGILNLAAGATLTTAGTITIGTGASGQGTLTSGGVLDAAAIDVGGTGTGTLAMSGGSLAVSGALAIGATANGVGFVALDGGRIGGDVVVGGSGAGNLVIVGAASIAGATVSVGVDVGGLGNLTIDGSGLDFTGTLNIGQGGIGAVTAEYGSVAGITAIDLAAQSGSSGLLVLNGATLQSGSFTLGDLGQGVLRLSNDATLITTGNATIADQAGGVMQNATIGQSQWTIDGNWIAGDAGSASVTLGAGGLVTALGGATIGALAGASGVVTLASGAGNGAAALHYAGLLAVGGAGTGTLALQSGAQIAQVAGQAGTIDIGVQSGGSGTLSLAGSSVSAQYGPIAGASLTATSLDVGSGGVLSLGAGSEVTATSITNAGGTIAGAGTITGALDNGGQIIATGGTLALGSVSGSGSLIVGAGADLTLNRTPAAGESIAFAGNAGTLALADPSALGAAITRIAAGDVIDLTQLSYNAADRVALLGGDVLDVNGAGGTLASQSFAPGLGLSAADFSLAADGSGTAITVVPCFVRGTHIRTTRGEVAVEALAVGDRVITRDGPRPVVWLGRRRIDLARHPQPEQVRPVRILRDAFGAGLPCRDLVLSPGHTLFIDGALIPAEALVNGASVRRERVERVEYFHVELDRHAVLFSENLPSESYLDIGNRAAFENGRVALLHPDFSAAGEPAALRCAPLALDGAPVRAARAGLLARLPALGFARVPGGGVAIHAAEATHRGCAGETLSLRLPAGLRTLLLRSPCFVPAGLGPEHEDCRSLGARIDALALDGEPLALDDTALAEGFHPIERQGGHAWRWTDGAAILRLPARTTPMTLRLTLGEAPAIWAAALPVQDTAITFR